MKVNKKILGRIIVLILITLLAAGFYFYLGRGEKKDKEVTSPPAAERRTEPAAKSKGPDAEKGGNTIELVRPPFLDDQNNQ